MNFGRRTSRHPEARRNFKQMLTRNENTRIFVFVRLRRFQKKLFVLVSVRREASYSHWVGVQYSPTDAELNS